MGKPDRFMTLGRRKLPAGETPWPRSNASKKGLARISNDFKVRLVEEREAEARRIRIDAERMMRSALDLAKAVEPGNIHSVRVADQARRDAEEAQRYGKPAANLGAPWELSGLGQLHEAAQSADRLICFGGD